MMKKALIIIDMQNDYFAGGKKELVGIDEALSNTLRLIEFAKEQKYEIFFIQHIALKENASFFLPKSKGVKLHQTLHTQDGSIITKHYPNSFRETILTQELEDKGIKNLIVCGAMTHMCVDTTVRAGFDFGFQIELINDACATKDLVFNDEVIPAKDIHNAFIASLNGIFCELKTTERFCNE